MNPQLQQQVQRAQNRIESYHQLRATIAQIGGKKKLSGKTDLEVELSNQCGRLIANVIIYYNSALLSQLLEIYQMHQNKEGLSTLSKISPVAWQNIYLTGHYLFEESPSEINLLYVLSHWLTPEKSST